MADKPGATHPQHSTAFGSTNSQPATMVNPISQAPLLHSSPSSFTSILSRLPQTTPAHPMATNSIRVSPATMAHPSLAPAPAPASSTTKEPKQFDISNLMSPPDPVMDSFNHANKHFNMVNSLANAPNGGQSAAKHPLPMSPPISPYSKPATTTEAPATPQGLVKDPLLYPSDDRGSSSPPQPPLFASAELEDHRHIIDIHLRSQSPSTFGNVSPPRREDYELVLSFRSQVMKHYTTNPKAWLRKERALLRADHKAGAGRYHSIMPAKPITVKAARNPRVDRVQKPQAAPRVIRVNGPGTGPTISHTPVARPAPRVSATPEPSRRIVAPNREDKDFGALPDYCPPINSLPSRANSLKVDWKGQPIDLSNDPHARLLHPDEVALAGNLRLDCATYLTSKRRIFERRLQCLKTGKEFRKTDAQQACKIDVNKASKLWTAFDKVGWLDAHWVRKYVSN